MYESFYHLREKPFTLLPDPGFLFLSDKHRMALTLLEYGLMNQAGFTVISGDIGAGKTTLIRHLLNNMDREHTVGLITNTHRSFGELLQWILLAFNLDHNGMDKVEMYQRFIDFIIDEYVFASLNRLRGAAEPAERLHLGRGGMDDHTAPAVSLRPQAASVPRRRRR